MFIIPPDTEINIIYALLYLSFQMDKSSVGHFFKVCLVNPGMQVHVGCNGGKGTHQFPGKSISYRDEIVPLDVKF